VLDGEAIESQDVGLSVSKASDQLRVALFEEPADPLNGLLGAESVRLGEDVRSVAATICWASLGTVASALRMK